MITRTDILAHLEYQVRTGFLLGAKAYSPRRAPFVMETGSAGAFETYADMGALPWPNQVSGQAGGSSDARTGAAVAGGLTAGAPVKMIGAQEKALIVYNDGFEVTVGIYHDAINDNRVGNLDLWARSAGARFEQHKDYLAFNALNAGEATTTYGAGYDGLSFFNDSHIDPGAEYQTAQDNKLATALSFDNFKAARIAAAKFKDDRGQPVGLSHDLLVVSADLEYEGAQITGNTQRYDTADRAVNPYAGGTSLVVAPGGWLDTTAWYLMVANMPQKPIIMQNRQAPTLYFWDDHTQGGGIRYYKWYSRYRAAYGDWRLAIQGQT